MISVIIPFYNAEKTILATLESVKNQHGNFNFEIILINDGSTDLGKEKVENFIKQNRNLTIKLVNQENKGVSFARNIGLKLANGEYIALLDADDVWLPLKTQKQMFFLENQNLKIDFLACLINQQKLFFPYSAKKKLAKVTFRKLLLRSGIATPSVLFKKKILNDTGFFDENQNFAEDHNFWLKISLHHNMYIFNENLVIAGNGKRTFGVSGLSANLKKMKLGFKKNLQEMYSLNKISFIEYNLYRIFYEAKYTLLLVRVFLNF